MSASAGAGATSIMSALLFSSLALPCLVTLACEDANSKLVEVVTVADVDDEKSVDGFGPDFEV